MTGLPWPDYDTMMAAWRTDAAGFWLGAAQAVDWHTVPRTAWRADADGHATWFPDGRLNTCFNALDRHVLAGNGARIALAWDSPASGAAESFTYAALLDRVARFAGGLRRLGVGMGDRVLITMPSVPEAVVAMLATARLGAVHVFVFGGFAAPELAARIEATRPRVVIMASCGYQGRHAVPYGPLVEAAFGLCRHRPGACVVLQRPGCPVPLRAGRDHDFRAVEASPAVEAVPVAADHPLYILHTSGTTGRPKGVVRDHGGHAVAMTLSMRLVYGMRPGEVFCTSSDLGWVVGHSYAVYGPLLAGCTSVLYEGGPVGTPDAGGFWRLCAAHRVRVFLTAPTALRVARQQDPQGHMAAGHDLSALQAVFVAGERADSATLDWAERATGAPVLDHWWQTETGWAIAGSFRGLGETRRSPVALGRPSPGFQPASFDATGRKLPTGQAGEIALRLPLPPGALRTLWEDEAGFRTAYLTGIPGHYRTFDFGALTRAGAIRLLARTDNVLKLAGRRIAGGLIEEAVAMHADVADCAVVARPDKLRGEVPVAYVVLAAGARQDAAVLTAELNALIREQVGSFAKLRQVTVVETLPKTRSGKILRRTLAGQERAAAAAPAPG